MKESLSIINQSIIIKKEFSVINHFLTFILSLIICVLLWLNTKPSFAFAMSFMIVFMFTGYYVNEFIFDSAYLKVDPKNKSILLKTDLFGKKIINKRLKFNNYNELYIKYINFKNGKNYCLILNKNNEEIILRKFKKKDSEKVEKWLFQLQST